MVYHIIYSGSLGNIANVGQVGTLKRIGTLAKINRVGSLGARAFTNHIEFGGTRHISRGSIYSGSWRDVQQYQTKTVSVMPSFAGTFHIHTSINGTGRYAGTYFTARVGAGTFTTLSFAEAVQYMKLRFNASGSSNTGKGTLSMLVAKQV